MKKKIAIIELETHSTLLEQWYSLLKEMRAIDFHFFIHKKIDSHLIKIPSSAKTVIDNLSEIENKIVFYDLFIINTFHRNFRDYAFVFKEKKVLCMLHNLNFSLFFKTINLNNFWVERMYFLYYLKLYFLEKIGIDRKIIQIATFYGVFSQPLLDEIKSKGKESALKSQLIQLNYCKSHPFENSDTIQIVLPGNISNKRKDMHLIFETLPKLNPKEPLHFTFLGKPESKTIEKKIQNLALICSDKVTISYYSKFIPSAEYTAVIAKSHLLLCAIKTKTSFYWVNEIYGKTKVSGSEADCIHNGKMGIFPIDYPKMNWSNLYFKNAVDLENILNRLSIKQLKNEQEKLTLFLKTHTFEQVKNQLENQLLTLISL